MLKHVWQKWFRGEDERKTSTPKEVVATFALAYRDIPVGVLTLAKGKWRFQYSDEFKKSDSLRPIVEFPDKDRVYETSELWPFFFMRIPSLKQAAVEDILKSEDIDSQDEMQLLRRFGRRTVANPFELIYKSKDEVALGR